MSTPRCGECGHSVPVEDKAQPPDVPWTLFGAACVGSLAFQAWYLWLIGKVRALVTRSLTQH